MNDIMVSICCLVYNHKNYIRQALDSFLMQKTNFRFEVLINDDCSTDGTTDIIKEYEAKYPDIIKPLYHDENQYSKSYRQGNMMSITFNFPRVSGKYTAMCEGDDFWTDELKLQKQVDFMEAHPQCSFCTHTVRCTNEKGVPLKQIIPLKDTVKVGVMSSSEAIEGICKLPYMFQTSSYFFRSEYLKEMIENTPEFFEYSSSMDILFMLYFASKGDVNYIDKEMSCYRHNSSSSIMCDLTAKDSNKNDKMIKHYTEHLKSLHAFNKYTKHQFDKSVTFAIRKSEYHLKLLKCDYKHLFSRKYKEVAPLFLSKSSKKEILKLRLLSLLSFLSKKKTKV